MGSEREIKLRVKDEKALRRALVRVSAKPVKNGSGRVHELNVIFDTPQGGLAKHGQLLRIRTETSKGKKGKSGEKRAILTFKQPSVGPPEDGRGRKVRDEFETEIVDDGALQKIFEGLGMSGW